MHIKLRIDAILPQISLVLITFGFWFDLIGFFTRFWFYGPLFTSEFAGFAIKGYSGLWKGCDDTNTLCYTPKGDTTGWFEATQAFETLGFIAALASLVLIILYIFVPATSGKRVVFILTLLACFAAAGCIILGIIIYGSKVKDNLSWSFALCTIAGIIFGVSGILLVIDMLKK